MQEFKDMKPITMFFLISLVFTSPVLAEDIQDLQQRASFDYEQMMKAKREAQVLANDAADAEKRQRQIENDLIKATEAAKAARQRSNEFNLVFDQAMLRWKQSSDELAQEWGKTER